MRSSMSKINRCIGLKQLLSLSINTYDKEALGSKFINNTLFRVSSTQHILAYRTYSTRLAEVGKFGSVQPDEICYPAGQPFLHRVFGYRGVILFPWLARVHDIDIRKQSPGSDAESQSSNLNSPSKRNLHSSISQNKIHHKNDSQSARISSTVTNQDISDANGTQHSTRFHPYYQVLIDTRDCPFVSNRTQTEAVTFLGHPDNNKSVYSIKGLDYVAHEDILPYTSHEEQPIQHELLTRLFRFDPDAAPSRGSKFIPSELLDSWRKKHTWLELSRVYRETTENIRVTVIPFYLGHTTIEDASFHWWRYCVRLENFSDVSVQLRERHWKIFSQTNMLQTIKGRGVVGVEPLLTKSEPAYQYSSHVNLQDKSGHMWGTFKMQRSEGHTFECRIPPFSLESSMDVTTPPSSKHHPQPDEEI